MREPERSAYLEAERDSSMITPMNTASRNVWLLAGLLALTSPAAAQSRGPDKVPPGQMPRAGLCRVWYDGRPPGRQPAATDCATAERDAARTGGRVLYGTAPNGKGKDNGKGNGRGSSGGVGNESPTPTSRDQYPATLPDMSWGAAFGNGQHRDDVRRWVGSTAVRAQLIDVASNGLPALVVWYDSRGTTMQRWIDDDRDGRADRVELFQNGQSVGVIR
jgi:hypothetical protein